MGVAFVGPYQSSRPAWLVYLHEYGSDVIFAAMGVSQVNQDIADFLSITIIFEHLKQFLVPHHFPQTIRAEQQTITSEQRCMKDIRVNIFVPCPQRAIN